jgi:hypothetical protein
MQRSTGEITLGVEEEFHIVDARTRHLVSKSGLLLDMLPKERFTEELQRSTLEANSEPCARLEDLGRDLGRMRETVIATAAEVGLGVVAAGSVPLADPEQMKISPDARYEQMLDDYQLLTREQLICGTQVHVQITDPDLAIAVAHRVAPYQLAVLARRRHRIRQLPHAGVAALAHRRADGEVRVGRRVPADDRGVDPVRGDQRPWDDLLRRPAVGARPHGGAAGLRLLPTGGGHPADRGTVPGTGGQGAGRGAP